MAPTADDGGYFFVASDGGTFAFGDATFEDQKEAPPRCAIVGMAVDSANGGYWLVGPTVASSPSAAHRSTGPTELIRTRMTETRPRSEGFGNPSRQPCRLAVAIDTPVHGDGVARTSGPTVSRYANWKVARVTAPACRCTSTSHRIPEAGVLDSHFEHGKIEPLTAHLVIGVPQLT